MNIPVKRSGLGILIFLSGVASQATSAEVAQTGALTLRRTVSAKASGMGEAYTAIPGDIEAMSFNPAGLAKLPSPTLSSTYFSSFADDRFGTINYAHSVPFGSVFIGGSYFDAGTIELNQSDGTRGSVRAQQDSLGVFGFAYGRTLPLSIGLTGKYLRSELAETASANAYAFDGGLQWKTPLQGFVLGGAVQNVGSDIKYEEKGDPLPQTVRAGASYTVDFGKLAFTQRLPYRVMLAVDGIKVRDEESALHAGLELSHSLDVSGNTGSAALRGGYRSEGRSFDIGIGFVIAQVTMDYSARIISDLDLSHRFSLGYRFSSKKN
ncbi:MAG: hypothetical protein KCHDKBKB_01445 [Elusimicrobia bacterium]|nr:hypothetical protein [Elusimicrobiota bacterium]